MSNGYGGLEPLPSLVDMGFYYDPDKTQPQPGDWGYSALGSASPPPTYVDSERRTVASPPRSPPPPSPLDPLPALNLPESKTVAERKCDTCAEAVAASRAMATEPAIRCLWNAASRVYDNRGRPLTDGLYSGDSDRQGLLSKLRARCSPAPKQEEAAPQQPKLPESKTVAAGPKCDTCARALALADSLTQEEAIRCLWGAAFRTFDGRGQPLTHGLKPDDPNRTRLLAELRARCQATESRTVAAPPKCETCAQALLVADYLPQEDAIRCLWDALSQVPDGRNGGLTGDLDPDDRDRPGLLAELRDRCAHPKCNTCLRALDVADSLPQEDAIACLWRAASQSPDGSGGTLVDGLNQYVPDRVGLLAELRARCQGTERTTVAERKCDTCAEALAASRTMATEPAIRCLWAALSQMPDGSGGVLTDDLDPRDRDRPGLLAELRARCSPALPPAPRDSRWPPWGDAGNDLLPGRRSKLRFPPTSRSCGERKPADRFELEQRQQRPWEQGWFPCPPDRDHLARNPDARLWWYSPPTSTDRQIAARQVGALKSALVECAAGVKTRALEPVTTFRAMEKAYGEFPAIIADLQQKATQWGAASLKGMRTLSIWMLFGVPYLGHIVGGKWFETISRDQVVDEYERRSDKFEGVAGLYIHPTYPGYQDALREALAFVDGERAYDNALFEVRFRFKELGKALKCRALYRLPDRTQVATAAEDLVNTQTGVLDNRYESLHQGIADAPTRYTLAEIVCELGHRLCCTLLRCRHLETGLKAIEAIETFRHKSSGWLRKGKAASTFGFGEDLGCDAFEVDDDFERTASAIISLSHTEHDCKFISEHGLMGWDEMAQAVRALAEEVQLNADDAASLEAQTRRRIGISEIFFFIGEVAEYLALALALMIIEVGVGVWRAWMERPPPEIPLGTPAEEEAATGWNRAKRGSGTSEAETATAEEAAAERARGGVPAKSEPLPRRAPQSPEDWEPEAARRRVQELADDGAGSHGPQRHEGQVTPEQHALRVRYGIDPATMSDVDYVTKLRHVAPKTSGGFTSNEAFAQAEYAARNSPEFVEQARAGSKIITIKDLPLSKALGPGYRNHVVGVTRRVSRLLDAPSDMLSMVDYSRGNVFAIYKLEDGSYVLYTMYPKAIP